MNRKEFIFKSSVSSGSLLLGNQLSAKAGRNFPINKFSYEQFLSNLNLEIDKLRIQQLGTQFIWGVANAAFQVEGATQIHNKLPSIWDEFSHQKGKIKNGDSADQATDFYHRFAEDVRITKELGFSHFRFSIAWTRVIAEDLHTENPLGIEYYIQILKEIHSAGLKAWVTLYHWDLPAIIEEQGGWANRQIINYFKRFVEICAVRFGEYVDRWFIVNEPAAFTALGYLTGYHAPGKKSPFNYLKTVHHVCLSIAEAGRLLRVKCPQKMIGIAYSYSVVHGASAKDSRVAKRVDAFLNRLFVEPSLGLGYPEEDLPVLKRLKNYFEPGDDELLKFNFDFVGVQYYFRVVVGKSVFVPFFGGREIPASKRGVAMNSMQREIYPEGLYDCLLRFKNYGFTDIVVSENGVCYRDQLKDGEVVDTKRIEFFQAHLDQLVRAKNEGIPINGYFVWSLTDNFEWSEGYNDRFGIVYIDYPTQKRIIKHSGQWWQRLLVVPSQ